ncbi:MAG: amidohydrolase family protein [Burkholderiaceae bacterium]
MAIDRLSTSAFSSSGFGARARFSIDTDSIKFTPYSAGDAFAGHGFSGFGHTDGGVDLPAGQFGGATFGTAALPKFNASSALANLPDAASVFRSRFDGGSSGGASLLSWELPTFIASAAPASLANESPRTQLMLPDGSWVYYSVDNRDGSVKVYDESPNGFKRLPQGTTPEQIEQNYRWSYAYGRNSNAMPDPSAAFRGQQSISVPNNGFTQGGAAVDTTDLGLGVNLTSNGSVLRPAAGTSSLSIPTVKQTVAAPASRWEINLGACQMIVPIVATGSNQQLLAATESCNNKIYDATRNGVDPTVIAPATQLLNLGKAEIGDRQTALLNSAVSQTATLNPLVAKGADPSVVIPAARDLQGTLQNLHDLGIDPNNATYTSAERYVDAANQYVEDVEANSLASAIGAPFDLSMPQMQNSSGQTRPLGGSPSPTINLDMQQEREELSNPFQPKKQSPSGRSLIDVGQDWQRSNNSLARFAGEGLETVGGLYDGLIRGPLAFTQAALGYAVDESDSASRAGGATRSLMDSASKGKLDVNFANVALGSFVNGFNFAGDMVFGVAVDLPLKLIVPGQANDNARRGYQSAMDSATGGIERIGEAAGATPRSENYQRFRDFSKTGQPLFSMAVSLAGGLRTGVAGAADDISIGVQPVSRPNGFNQISRFSRTQPAAGSGGVTGFGPSGGGSLLLLDEARPIAAVRSIATTQQASSIPKAGSANTGNLPQALNLFSPFALADAQQQATSPLLLPPQPDLPTDLANGAERGGGAISPQPQQRRRSEGISVGNPGGQPNVDRSLWDRTRQGEGNTLLPAPVELPPIAPPSERRGPSTPATPPGDAAGETPRYLPTPGEFGTLTPWSWTKSIPPLPSTDIGIRGDPPQEDAQAEVDLRPDAPGNSSDGVPTLPQFNEAGHALPTPQPFSGSTVDLPRRLEIQLPLDDESRAAPSQTQNGKYQFLRVTEHNELASIPDWQPMFGQEMGKDTNPVPSGFDGGVIGDATNSSVFDRIDRYTLFAPQDRSTHFVFPNEPEEEAARRAEMQAHQREQQTEQRELQRLQTWEQTQQYRYGGTRESQLPIIQQVSSLGTIATGSDLERTAKFIESLPPQERAKVGNAFEFMINHSSGTLPPYVHDSHSHASVVVNPNETDRATGTGAGSYDPLYLGYVFSGMTKEKKIQWELNRRLHQLAIFPGKVVEFNVAPRYNIVGAPGSPPTYADGSKIPDYYLARDQDNRNVLGTVSFENGRAISSQAIKTPTGWPAIAAFNIPQSVFETLIRRKIPEEQRSMQFVAAPVDARLHFDGPSLDRSTLDAIATLINAERTAYNTNRIADNHIVGFTSGNPRENGSAFIPFEQLRIANMVEDHHNFMRGTFKLMVGETNLSKESVQASADQLALVDNTSEQLQNLNNWLSNMSFTGLIVNIHMDSGRPAQANLNAWGGGLSTFFMPTDLANIPRFIKLANDNPNADIVWAHAGLGYTVQPVPKYVDWLQEVLDAAPNVKIDISWDTIHPYIRSDVNEWARFIVRNQDRVLFGSDTIATAQNLNSAHSRRDVYQGLLATGLINKIDALDPSQVTKERLLRGNFELYIDKAVERVNIFRAHPQNADWLGRRGWGEGGPPPMIWQRDRLGVYEFIPSRNTPSQRDEGH